jgi:molecular chaperone GrpE (heat shock protein)
MPFEFPDKEINPDSFTPEELLKHVYRSLKELQAFTREDAQERRSANERLEARMESQKKRHDERIDHLTDVTENTKNQLNRHDNEIKDLQQRQDRDESSARNFRLASAILAALVVILTILLAAVEAGIINILK